MRFQVHDEIGHPWAEGFLTAFVPAIAGRLVAALGLLPVAMVHIILSDRRTHEKRFPPRPGESAAARPRHEEEGGESAAAVVSSYDRSAYAHGIATTVDARHRAPASATVGELAIYLDIETVERLADETRVPPEAMIGRVVAHELAHILRGHATASACAVHGWVEEGDAQRDAWYTLTELLADPTWSRIARWGRAAQMRLARAQPPAYGQFGAEEPNRVDLLDQDPAERPVKWVIRPPRRVFRLVRGLAVETPAIVAPRSKHEPTPGDHFYLSDADMSVGPWALVSKRPAPCTAHPADTKAVDSQRQKAETSWPKQMAQFEWLQLRRVDPLHATRAQFDFRFASRMTPTVLKPAEALALSRQLTLHADAVAQDVAAEELASQHAGAEEMIATLTAAGRPVPDCLNQAPGDPFDDWS